MYDRFLFAFISQSSSISEKTAGGTLVSGVSGRLTAKIDGADILFAYMPIAFSLLILARFNFMEECT